MPIAVERFTGKERDAETGLDYFGARYMSVAMGRWTGADAPFADQFSENPQSWNLYAYVRNNPQRYVDANGRETGVLPFGDGKVVIPRPENAGGIRPQRTVPISKREALIHTGTIQLAGAVASGGATLGMQTGLGAALGVVSTSGLLVNGTTNVLVGVTGGDTDKALEANAAVGAVTTPAGLMTTVATGSTRAGAFVSDVSGAVALARNPEAAIAAPVETSLTGGLTLGGLLISAVEYFLPATPPPPPPPLPPPPPAPTPEVR